MRTVDHPQLRYAWPGDMVVDFPCGCSSRFLRSHLFAGQVTMMRCKHSVMAVREMSELARMCRNLELFFEYGINYG